jgi:hypothetical protein
LSLLLQSVGSRVGNRPVVVLFRLDDIDNYKTDLVLIRNENVEVAVDVDVALDVDIDASVDASGPPI